MPIDPALLSALLDGELTPGQARLVRKALETDEALRRDYERLAALHDDLRAAGQGATFSPQVVIPRATSVLPGRLALVLAVLLGVRLLAKVSPVALGIPLACLILILALAWTCGRLLHLSDGDLDHVRVSPTKA